MKNERFPLGVLHTIVCAFIMVYYFGQFVSRGLGGSVLTARSLVLRRNGSESLLVSTGMDFAINTVLLSCGTALEWTYSGAVTV